MRVKFRSQTANLFDQSEPYRLRRRLFKQFKLWAFRVRFREIQKNREPFNELEALAEAVVYSQDKGNTFDDAYKSEFDSFCTWMAYKKRRGIDCTLINRLCELDAEAGSKVKTLIVRMEHGQ